MKTIYLDLDSENRVVGWGTSPITPEAVEVDVEEDHGLLRYHGSYRYIDNAVIEDTAFLLDEAKKKKFAELSSACQQAIMGYFEATVNSVAYLFSFDYEAQSNFTGTLALFTKGLILEMEWTVHRDGVAERIKLNESQFLQVVSTAFAHKNAKISRLRNDIQPLLDSAVSVDEVNAIAW